MGVAMSELPHLLPLSTLYSQWKEDVESGEPPIAYQTGIGGLTLAPKQVLLIGAPPGRGKTMLVMQATFDALRFHPDLKALVANVEMPPEILLERELSRVSGVPATAIHTRQYRSRSDYCEKVKQAWDTFQPLLERVHFLQPPYAMDNLVLGVKQQQANIVVVDYLQRFAVKHDQQTTNTRERITEAMDMLRQLVNWGVAVIVVSSLARDKGASGKGYREITLASFRDSSELEYGCDIAYGLEADPKAADGAVVLRNLKRRYGESGEGADIVLRFNPSHCKFSGGAV